MKASAGLRSVELDEIESGKRAAGELDEARAHRQRPKIDPEEPETVDQSRKIGFRLRIIARIEQHAAAALAAGITGHQRRKKMVERLDQPRE